MRRRVMVGTMALAWGLVGCGDDPSEPEEGCVLEPLPFNAQADGPTVTDVALEDQGGERIVLHVTATDPQGSADLVDVDQTVGVFPDARCEGAPVTLRDDLVGSGVEETFGTVVEAATDPALHAAIAGSAQWPVSVEIRDASGNVLSGRVAARVFR